MKMVLQLGMVFVFSSTFIHCQLGSVGVDVNQGNGKLDTNFCATVPAQDSYYPAVESCNLMDWSMTEDGYYYVSQFGTSWDLSTFNHRSSCGVLQAEYNAHKCRYEHHVNDCLDGLWHIPFIQGHVSYSYYDVASDPKPEHFYIADAQRFGCGALLRVSNPNNSRCVVVYTEDAGPNAALENPYYKNHGGRRVVDSSPAVIRALDIQSKGWAHSDLIYVEWGLPGDEPGQECTPCQSIAAMVGTEDERSPYSINQMFSDFTCLSSPCGDGVCDTGEDNTICSLDCPICQPIPPEGRSVTVADLCFQAGGTPRYWYKTNQGTEGSLLWTYSSNQDLPDNHGIWTLRFSQAGTYRIEAYSIPTYAQSQQAPYQIRSSGLTHRVTADQTSGSWITLGSFEFDSGSEQWVRLDDNSGESAKRIVFGTIRVTPLVP